jgi:hypothetical protein
VRHDLCLEGTGALSISRRNKPEVFNEPCVFAAVAVKGDEHCRVLEGRFRRGSCSGGGTRSGASGRTYGLPRFRHAAFARAPVRPRCAHRSAVPLTVELTG